MLTGSPVLRSACARSVFLTSAAITIAILWWAFEASYSWIHIPLSASFFYLFTVLDQTAAAVELLILIGAVFLARSGWLGRVAAWLGDHVLVVAAATVVVLSAGALLVYHDHPLSMDEYAAYFQSQAFAAGHLTGRFPTSLLDRLIPPGFQNYFLYVSRDTGAVASAYWPSFALLLTPFTWLGVPWACNPAISALTVLVIHRLALRLFADREAAGFAVLLTIASPVFFADGISYYSMSAHLLANAVYALLLLRPAPYKACVAGLVGSIALTLHNPVPHFLFALPWLLWLARQDKPLRLLACLSAGYLPLCIFLGIGWFKFIHTLSQGVPDHTAGPSTVISQATALAGAVFSLPTVDILYARLVGVAKVWVWAVPGLVLLACVGAWKLRSNAQCRLLAASAAITLLGYLLVPVDQGHGWGYRYFHSAWFVLPLLAAGLLARTRAPADKPDSYATDDVRAFVTACAILTLTIGVGHRAVQIHGFIAEALDGLPRYPSDERRVTFVNTSFFYTADLVQNDPWLRGNVIRMVSRGRPDDTALMREYFPQMQMIYDDPHGSVWVSRTSLAQHDQP
jgi:hypothetical protein